MFEFTTVQKHEKGHLEVPSLEAGAPAKRCELVNRTSLAATLGYILPEAGMEGWCLKIDGFCGYFGETSRFVVMPLTHARVELEQLVAKTNRVAQMTQLPPLSQLLCVNAVWAGPGGPGASHEPFLSKPLAEGVADVAKFAEAKWKDNDTKQQVMEEKIEAQAKALLEATKDSKSPYFLQELDEDSFNYYTLENGLGVLPTQINLDV